MNKLLKKINVHVSTLNLQRALHPKEDVHTDFSATVFLATGIR